MKLLPLFSLSFTSILLTKCALADDFLKRLPFAPENGYQNNEKTIHLSPLKFDSSYALMRNNTNKHLTGCAIPPDSNGHVDIPGDWTSIGDYAFYYCQELKSVTIPASVITIGGAAFFGCNSLAEVTFSPDSALTTIGGQAFQSTGLLSVTIPASVTTIGDSAFYDCNRLTEIIFSPDSALTTIGGSAFYQSGLLSVTIPASVTTIGYLAFHYCNSLAEVTFSPGSALTTIGGQAFQSTGLLSVTIPASVTTIGYLAFYGCNSLAEVTFSPGSALTTIGDGVFSSSGLLSVTIPASVTTIDNSAFYDCIRLTEIIFSPDSALTTIGGSAFESSGLLSVTIPASVTTINTSAFCDCNSLAEVTFSPGSALTTIGGSAFYQSGLLSVTIPASVTTIGDNAFYDCNRLTVVIFSAGSALNKIGVNAFGNCNSLTEVNFLSGSALTTIRNNAVYSSGLLSVILPASVTTIGAGTFGSTKIFKQKCAIPPDSTGHVNIPENWTRIADRAFVSCSELRSIHIPASVTFIGNYAFYHSKHLTHVTFAPDSTLTTIETDAFYSSGLMSMILPASVTTIGDNAFKDCNRLTQVSFSSGSALATIGNDAFGKYVQFECLNTDIVTYSVSAFLCRTPCYKVNQLRQPDGSCECIQGSTNVDGDCILCQNGYSTLQGGNQCVAAKPVHILNEKKCRGYPSIRNLLPENSVSIKYMSSSEEKMIVFSGVPKAFFDAVATVEVRYLISHRKVSVGNTKIGDVLSKDQDYYNKRYLLAVPSYTGQTSFDLSFASCADQLLKSGSTGKYISKVRLIFYGVSPESMLTFDTIAGCKDYYLDQETPFLVDDGVCFYNPEMFE